MDCEIIIIGAGVVGLAIAETLSGKGKNIVVLERHISFGSETSSRNSEVIHSGIYYPSDSLKAKLCVSGNRSIYSYCDKKKIAYKKCGKYIIAVTDDEQNRLENILRNASNNGVTGIRNASINELRKNEPNIFAASAVFAPETGIVDTHGFMKSLETDCVANGCSFVYNHSVEKIEKTGDGFLIYVRDIDGNSYSLKSEIVINSAGLDSDRIAGLAGIDLHDAGYNLFWCRGHYFRLASSPMTNVTHLIYPVPPTNAGLGIHLTIDLEGGLKLGPDTMYLNERKQDYSIPNKLSYKFYESVRRFLPALQFEMLSPDQSGIRPKLQSPGGEFRDFIINEESGKGLPGLINLIGIESPGFTSSLEIAKYVANLI